MIREGDKVTLPTEPGVVQVVGKGVTSDTNAPMFKVDCIYGHVTGKSWFKPVGDTLVGMGSKTVYDQNGNKTSYEECETGCVMTWS